MNPIVKGDEVKYNYLDAAEMSEEGNYNMIDGIINNVSKPSVLEQMREYERHISEISDTENNDSLSIPRTSATHNR